MGAGTFGGITSICANLSMLTIIEKIGLVFIQTLIVTVMRDPEGIVEKPEILIVCRSTNLYTRLLELTVEVFA